MPFSLHAWGASQKLACVEQIFPPSSASAVAVSTGWGGLTAYSPVKPPQPHQTLQSHIRIFTVPSPVIHMLGHSLKFLNKQHAGIFNTSAFQQARRAVFMKCHFLFESAVNGSLVCIPEVETGSYCRTACAGIPPFRDSDTAPWELCHRSRLLSHLRGDVCDMQAFPVSLFSAKRGCFMNPTHVCLSLKNSFPSRVESVPQPT